jgi:hypothetical protein
LIEIKNLDNEGTFLQYNYSYRIDLFYLKYKIDRN